MTAWSAEILVVTGEVGLIYDHQRARQTNFLLEARWNQLADPAAGNCAAAEPSTGGRGGLCVRMMVVVVVD